MNKYFQWKSMNKIIHCLIRNANLDKHFIFYLALLNMRRKYRGYIIKGHSSVLTWTATHSLPSPSSFGSLSLSSLSAPFQYSLWIFKISHTLLEVKSFCDKNYKHGDYILFYTRLTLLLKQWTYCLNIALVINSPLFSYMSSMT